MHEKIRERKLKLINAGYDAVDELIKVVKAKIVKEDLSNELAAEKMKTAAQAKKIAIEDAFDILSRIQKEEESLADDSKGILSDSKTQTTFAEQRANRK
jgi:hypothetical protein